MTYRNATAVIMKMAYGYTVGPDDPFVQLAQESSQISGWATTPGRWLVDYYPLGPYPLLSQVALDFV